MNPLFSIPDDFAALTLEQLQEFIEAASATREAIRAAAEAGDVSEFLAGGRTFAGLRDELAAGVAAIDQARAALATLEAAATEPPAPTGDELAGLADLAQIEEPVAPEGEPAVEPEPPAAAESVVAAAPEPVVASPAPRGRPAQSAASRPRPAPPRLTLLASADGDGEISLREFGREALRRHKLTGNLPDGVNERVTIARASWSEQYSDDQRLDDNADRNSVLLASATSARQEAMRDAYRRRRDVDALEEALTAAGGICAPVTPFYGLQNVSQAARPVRDALMSFNADRGGMRFAAPASLASITTAVGIVTAANDKIGGTFATKACQRIDCPAFSEVDVDAIYHCLTVGNLPQRTFPELVAQWGELVVAAQARKAESNLLDGIAAASKKVTATSLGLGASASFPNHVITAAAAFRSRHRMDPEAVLRTLVPAWITDLLVSDVYRGQFERFDMDRAAFVQLMRAANVEPTFYLDQPTSGAQIFGTQSTNTPLLTFPPTAIWYIYPEGSFTFLDGGTLELGLVRDSVLNAQNDLQLFGETWEQVAFTGVESYQVISTLCDSGTVSLPSLVHCPLDYSHSS